MIVPVECWNTFPSPRVCMLNFSDLELARVFVCAGSASPDAISNALPVCAGSANREFEVAQKRAGVHLPARLIQSGDYRKNEDNLITDG